MSFNLIGEKIKSLVRRLQKFVERVWYPPFIAILALLDNFIVIIPNDGILISSAMLKPKRWIVFAVAVAIGSAVGAVALAALVEFKGLEYILNIYPGLTKTSSWVWSDNFFKTYGLVVVFLVAVTPFVQQPAIILASLAQVPIVELAAAIFIGRLIKFLIMAYVGARAPDLLSKLWGVRGELEDVGIKLK